MQILSLHWQQAPHVFSSRDLLYPSRVNDPFRSLLTAEDTSCPNGPPWRRLTIVTNSSLSSSSFRYFQMIFFNIPLNIYQSHAVTVVKVFCKAMRNYSFLFCNRSSQFVRLWWMNGHTTGISHGRSRHFDLPWKKAAVFSLVWFDICIPSTLLWSTCCTTPLGFTSIIHELLIIFVVSLLCPRFLQHNSQ